MSTKPPPVPPANRAPGEGPQDDAAHGAGVAAALPRTPGSPDKQGQAANTKVNTTHQGHQQDR